MANKNFKVQNKLEIEGVITTSNLTLSDEYPTIPPSLNLDFANSKVLDPRIDFTRSSSGSYYDSDGLLKLASVNKPRFDHDPVTGESKGLLIEESRTNLLTYSENFDNAAWAKVRSSIIPNSTIAPDGTLTASKLVEDTSTNTHVLEQTATISSGVTYTLSVYVKAAERTSTLVQMFLGSSNGVAVNLTNGAIITTSDANNSVISVGNGWYRISKTFTSTVTGTGYFDVFPYDGATATYTGNGNSGIYIWGTQLEVGTFPTSYIPSNDTFTSRASTATYIGSDGLIKTAAINEARYNYNPLNLGLAPKLLLESSSNNIITYSEDFSNAVWSKGNTTITVNATTAPDGSSNADKLVENTTTYYHGVARNITVLSGNTYCESVYLKAAERTQCHLLFYTDTIYHGYKIDLLSGTASTSSVGGVTDASANAIITSVGNGWYRCSLSKTMIGTTFQIHLRLYNSADIYTGDGVSGIYVWGAQSELGTYPTSYIPTTSSFVVRSADVSSSAAATRSSDLASISGSNFTSWYRQDEGTLFVEYPIPLTAATGYPSIAAIRPSLNVGSATTIEIFTSNQHDCGLIRNYGIDQAATITQLAVNTNVKSILSYASNNSTTIVNGSIIGTDTSCIIPKPMKVLQIGYNQLLANAILVGTIKQIKYYPERLSNNILVNLTK